MGNDRVEGNYEQVILDLLTRVKRLEGGEVRGSEVSDSFESLGLIEAGEVRVHKDYLDPKEPGDGFSGIRIVGEGIEINGVMYAFVGYNADTATIGLSAETGEMFFCNFNAVINQDGITGTELLKWMIRQTATYGTDERYGQLGMEELDSKPAWTLSFYEPSGSAELVNNGDFETGDFTGWTKTTETNCSWIIADPLGGSPYAAHAHGPNQTGSTINITAVLTSDRTLITDGGFVFNADYTGRKTLLSGVYPIYDLGNLKIEIKWYDHASAGSLISTTIIWNSACSLYWATADYNGIAPSGTLSAVIVVTFTGALPHNYYARFIIDDISLKETPVSQKLQLTDDGVSVTNGLYPKSQMLVYYQMRDATGGMTAVLTSSAPLGGQGRPTTITIGNLCYYDVLLEKGTYTLEYRYTKANNAAQTDIYIDDVKIVSALDQYAASLTYDQLSTTTSISVTYSGAHIVKLVGAAKNASSSNYSIVHTALIWTKTA